MDAEIKTWRTRSNRISKNFASRVGWRGEGAEEDSVQVFDVHRSALLLLLSISLVLVV